MLAKLAVWYLRKKKKSVLIGYEIVGGQLKALSNDNYIYDNKMINVDYRIKNDEKFDIPSGKFHVRRDKNEKHYT